MDKTIIESLSIIQKTPSKLSDTMLTESHQWNTNPNLNVAESENIGANHLGFVKFLFQQYSQQLRLNSNYYPAESAFNFYVNNRITKCLEGTVNIEAARENFYTELFQHTNLPRNYSFVPIIREINQTIEKYTQQQFSITYADKGKGRIQTPAATPKEIQLPSWKKHRVESPTASLYHYTFGSAINISSADASTSNMTLTEFDYHHLNQTLELLPFETLNIQAQQSLNLENLEIETPNHQRQNNLNPELIAKLIQQPFQLPPQQPVQQQPLQQPPQPPNLDPMAYAPITKLDNFTGEEDDAQVWLNDIEKAITMKFVRYFSNNNSINKLANFFTTIKQKNTEAVTTYLGCFHRNLHQIQAIQADYFTASQILNQFIRGLCSNLLQRVCPMHLVDLPIAVTHARDFEAAELEANHVQAVNLVMNRSSKLDSKLKQFSESINQKLEIYLADNLYCGSRKCMSATTIVNKAIFELRPISKYLSANDAATNLSTASISTFSLSTAATGNLSTAASSNLSAAAPNNLSVSTINPNTTPKLSYDDIRKPKIQNCSKLEIGNSCSSTGTDTTQNSTFQHYLSLLVTSEDALTSNQEPTQKQQTLTSNIPPATVTNDKLLAAIFPFEIKEPSSTPLFNGAALNEKRITAMYTNAKVDGQFIKLILDSSSAGSIITQQLMNQLGRRVDQAASARIITADGMTKTPIGKIDDFSFKVNGIVTPIKVLVMKATQYQALIGNDWLSKVNAMLNWNIQELQLTYQGQHIRVPATCGHFKTPPREKLLIKLEEEKEKPI
ncbi:hypothetical protein G9A89_012346 [Geosiphon pyriformis]|nr:hypothetical protein G9A89_012346 [Geosiphon pyriformis]